MPKLEGLDRIDRRLLAALQDDADVTHAALAARVHLSPTAVLRRIERPALPIDGPLPTCTTWIVLRRDRVLRDYALEFIARLAPQLDRRDVRRAFDHGIAAEQWPEPPRWRDLDAARLAA